ncbi:DUF2273 domain-containing protein [Thermaerobacter litoralis]
MEEGRGFWQRHAGKVTGAVAGFLIALLVKWIGLGWTLLGLALAWVGLQVGSRIDEGDWEWPEGWERWWNRWSRRA